MKMQHSIAIDIEQKKKKETTSALSGIARNQLFQRLAKIQKGGLTVIENSRMSFFGDKDHPLQATLTVHDEKFYKALLTGGSLGVAEAYILGLWDCDDLTTMFRIFLQNKEELTGIEKSFSWLNHWKNKLFALRSRNSMEGSKRNIVAHYDLSNEFYQLWLDPTMTYSSGIFPSESSSMEEASVEKLDRICRNLELTSNDHVLEIGTGWGSFSIHAAKHYGCRVTTTTISDEQYRLAKERVAEAGLEDKITVLNRDYRLLDGQYDKVVSIEMIEAVGHEFMQNYVEKIDQVLKPGGKAALQAITIDERIYNSYRSSVDFIKKYIFPGGNLVSLNYLNNLVKDVSGMRPVHMEEIGLHYAETLRRWRERFENVVEDVKEMGFSERFVRMWRYYLTYCEAGFEEKHIGTAQLVYEKVR